MLQFFEKQFNLPTSYINQSHFFIAYFKVIGNTFINTSFTGSNPKSTVVASFKVGLDTASDALEMVAIGVNNAETVGAVNNDSGYYNRGGKATGSLKRTFFIGKGIIKTDNSPVITSDAFTV